MVPPCSDRIARVPPYSSLQLGITCTGLSPTEAQLSRWFQLSLLKHWPSPRSLATTSGVSVDVLSSGYLDVSVPRVCFLSLCIQDKIPSCDTLKSEPGNCFPDANYKMSKVGFPIRKSTDRRLFAPSRSLSQRTTSFIASYRQGIHQMPLGHLIALISNAHPYRRTQTRSAEETRSARRRRQDGHYVLERPEVIEINPSTRRGQASVDPFRQNRRTLMSTSS